MEQMEQFWIIKDIKIKNFISEPSRSKFQTDNILLLLTLWIA